MCGNSSLFLEDLHHETQWYYVLLRRRRCRGEVTLMVRICVFLSVLSIWCSILKQSSTVTVKSTSATASLTTFVSCVEVGDNNTIWYIIESTKAHVRSTSSSVEAEAGLCGGLFARAPIKTSVRFLSFRGGEPSLRLRQVWYYYLVVVVVVAARKEAAGMTRMKKKV